MGRQVGVAYNDSDLSRLIDPNGTVEVVSVSRTPIGGLGSLSTLTRLVVDYLNRDGSNGRLSLVLKQEATHPDSRAVATWLRAGERECGMFTDFRDLMDEVSIGCLDVHIEPESGVFDLLLEDLGDQVLPTQLEGATPELTKGAMQKLALLHASTWGISPTATPSWCPVPGGDVEMELWRRFHEAWPEFFQRYRSTLPPDALAVAARFAEAMPDLTVRWAESDVGCIIHGDARMDNLLAGKRGDVRLIDWQTASRGNGAFDLAHFIAGSLTVEDRRQYEVELLQLYLRSLQSHGIGSIDYESLSRDVRKTLLLVLPLNVIFGAGDPPDAHADRSRRAVLGRYFTALSEWGSGNFLT